MTARLFECTFILVGIVAVLGIITLRNQDAGASEGTLSYTLAAIKDWTFLLGPGGSSAGERPDPRLHDVSLRLVPAAVAMARDDRWAAAHPDRDAILFGGNDPSSGCTRCRVSPPIPEAGWELFLGVYCTIWGFRKDAPILAEGHEPQSTSAPTAALSPA